MSARTVARARGPLRGPVRVPGDKSVGHRALLLGTLAEGTLSVRGLSAGEDVRSTRPELFTSTSPDSWTTVQLRR